MTKACHLPVVFITEITGLSGFFSTSMFIRQQSYCLNELKKASNSFS
jgi:hypothetical protein